MDESKLISALIGALVAIVAMSMNNWHQNRRQRQELLTAKLEVLYSLCLEFSRRNQKKYDLIIDYIIDERGTIQELFDMHSEIVKIHSKMKMIVNLYFPNLLKEHRKVWPLLLAFDKQFYLDFEDFNYFEHKAFKESFKALSIQVFFFEDEIIKENKQLL
ncbi:hypothetical protein [Thalassomonas sp. RHCl1]|uniref:hypothetical protein n=1 Tax=Thalassomonas sp. RHCl1 TaxID=2995320 RepID=UPI00248B5505|nr:hypothetical protein [Thalassomonas sp. RHCl1]